MSNPTANTATGLSAAPSSLQLPPALSEALRKHQIAALHFLWRRLVDDGVLRMAARTHGSTLEQRALLYQEVYGCIIGHSMGLGKTLTALSFLLLLQAQVMLMSVRRQQARLKTQSAGPEERRCATLRVLVLCPKSCIRHWLDSVKEWVRPELFGRISLACYAPSTVPARKLESILQDYHGGGGMLVLGYEEYTRLAVSLAQRPVANDWYGDRVWSVLDGVRQRLPLRAKVRYLDVLEGADVVVLDEAHRLKRSTSRPVQTLRRHLRGVQLRVALTGTPLQNHLEEYNVMQSVITGNDLDSSQFNRYYVTPIQLGQCSDSSFQQFSEMQRCVASLRQFFGATVHHCGPEELERVLPPRREFLFFFSLSERQEAVYRTLLKHFRLLAADPEQGGGVPLMLHHQASHISLHPCLMSSTVLEGGAGGGGAALTRPHRRQPLFKAPVGGSDASLEKPFEEGAKDAEGDAGTGTGIDSDSAEETADDDDEAAGGSPGNGGVAPADVDIADSPKLLFALDLIDHITDGLREKVVVFSLYLSHLRLLQTLLLGRLDPAQQDAPKIFSGSTPDAQRAAFVADFHANPRCRVLLCSVRAGGVGINLTAANHCILLDVSWNPADDTQATYRVYRFGQTRPVTVYRLAAYGTTEQVVFAYALQKTWVHRKIADVVNPTRTERHMKRNYFTYPCRVPIDDGVSCSGEGSLDGQAQQAGQPAEPESSRSSGERQWQGTRPERHSGGEGGGGGAQERLREQRLRASHFLSVCEKECPEAARVLRAEPILRESLRSFVQRSLLLRDDSAEAIAEMESRFRETQRRREAHVPIAMADENDLLSARVGAAGRRRRGAVSLLDECEDALVDKARTAANHIIWYVVQRRQDAGLPDTEADTTAVVRETDRALCSLWQSLLLTAPSATTGPGATPSPLTFQNLQPERPQASPPSSFTALAEVLLYIYQEGARHAVTSILSQSSFTKLRTYLTSRIPKESLAASPRHVRRSTLTHGVLEDTLLFRPYELLSRVDPVEQTYLATEMGFVRPLVEQCVFLGLHRSLSRLLGSSGEAAETTLTASMRTLLAQCFCDGSPNSPNSPNGPFPPFDTTHSSSGEDISGDDGVGASMALSQAESVPWQLDVLVRQLLQTMERCLDDLWPSGGGFELPPMGLSLAEEEARMTQLYRVADTLLANTGAVTPSEAAAVLGMARSQVRSSLFTCPRCGRSTLSRTADTTLSCPLCCFNAEFALRNDPRYQHSMTLFQLSFACNLLDAFSISRSFSTAFAPATCESVWEVLLRLRVGQSMFRFVERCMTDGVHSLLAEYPVKHVQLLALQSGAGDERDLLQRVLLANASFVWDERLRKHVKDGLAYCFRNLLGPCALTSLASMPLMSIILSLHLAAQHEEVNFAAELLEGDAASNVFTAGPTGSRKRALLRFACDSLVKLLYAEKLMELCRTAPEPMGKAEGEGNSRNEEGEQGGFSDLDSLSLSSSRPRSPSPQKSPLTEAPPPKRNRHGHRQDEAKRTLRTRVFPALLRQPSSSSSSHSSEGSPRRRGRHPRRRVKHKAEEALRRRAPRSASSSSFSFSASSSSSSFGTRYSSDDGAAAPAHAVAARGAGPDDGDHVNGPASSSRRPGPEVAEEEEEEEGKTAEQLEDEATLKQRSAQYWVAFCEVYGTRSVDSLTVFVEDEELGMTILPPPPPLFWVSNLMKASKDGKTMTQVIDCFLEKILQLSQNARLITES